MQLDAESWQTDLAAWFDERTRTHEFSGHAIAWRDGAPIFSYVGGLAHRGHGVPVREGTRFAVASVTKMATAIAALRLVDRGELALDTPLVEILPADQRPTAMTRQHSLHHLLSHTSGLATISTTTTRIPARSRPSGIACRATTPAGPPTCCRCSSTCPPSPRLAPRSATTTAASSSRVS